MPCSSLSLLSLLPIKSNLSKLFNTFLSPSLSFCTVPFQYSLNSSLHTIHSLQTVSILLLLAVPSRMLISSLQYLLFPPSTLASSSHSFIFSNPWPPVLARLYCTPASLPNCHPLYNLYTPVSLAKPGLLHIPLSASVFLSLSP